MANKSTDIITPDTPSVSEPFTIEVGKQVQLYARGLQGADRVLVEVVSSTRSGPLPSECCPGPVALPEVSVARVLRCRNNARAILTADYPVLTLDSPQDVELRAHLEADEDAVVYVSLLHSDADDCSTCACVEPYCASYPLTPRGYAFAEGDATDPDATVLHAVVGQTVRLYPTSRIGASVPVRHGAVVVGFALNTSACAGAQPAVAYCPSLQLDTGECQGASEVGYAYRDNAVRDPAATVPLDHCTGEVSYGYPAPGVYGNILAEVPYYGGTDTVIAYLANRSDCAPAQIAQC